MKKHRHTKAFYILCAVGILLIGLLLYDEGIPRLQQLYNTYHSVDTSKSAKENFAPERIQLSVDGRIVSEKASILESLENLLFKEKAPVKDVVYTLNKAYLSSLLSGDKQLFPKEQCVTEDIYKEINARSLYQMAAWENIGEGVQGTHLALDIKQLVIKEDMAKVIVKRTTGLLYQDPKIGKQEYQTNEGYLLKKVNGTWKIENILFNNMLVTKDSSFVAPLDAFAESKEKAQWQEQFSLTNWTAEKAGLEHHYRDYLVGELPKASINLSMMHLAKEAPALNK